MNLDGAVGRRSGPTPPRLLPGAMSFSRLGEWNVTEANSAVPDEHRTEVALIVGGGPGISASCARLFSSGGMRVAVAARNPDKPVLQVLEETRGGDSPPFGQEVLSWGGRGRVEGGAGLQHGAGDVEEAI